MTNRREAQLFAIALVLALLLAGVALAQDSGSYDLTWWTVDGGGGTVEGGGYTLMSTAGESSPATALSGGDYTLISSFWSAGRGAPPACIAVTGVNLTLLTSGDIYTDTLVALSADIAPDGAHKPYTYTVDYDDEQAITATSSDDPLTTPLDHTFSTVGTHEVQIKVWNCDMAETEARSDSVTAVVSGYVAVDKQIYLPLVVRKH